MRRILKRAIRYTCKLESPYVIIRDLVYIKYKFLYHSLQHSKLMYSYLLPVLVFRLFINSFLILHFFMPLSDKTAP